MNSLRDNEALRGLLDRLHAASEAQEAAIDGYYAGGAARPTGYEPEGSDGRRFWQDKYVALDRDKAELTYALARAAGARQVVEAGTSFGVSTLYLAAAVHDNTVDNRGGEGPGGGRVITCDIEPEKVAVARRHFADAGLADVIETRVGDIRQTLAENLDHEVDLLLLDIWAPVAADVIALVGPRLRVGGMVVADNTTVRRELYAGLFAHLDDPANGFAVTTLPYSGGLCLAVRTSSPQQAAARR
ncbi:MAG: class I SAM-dependent methyltransferase [Acidimicrobiales bacterium]